MKFHMSTYTGYIHVHLYMYVKMYMYYIYDLILCGTYAHIYSTVYKLGLLNTINSSLGVKGYVWPVCVY